MKSRSRKRSQNVPSGALFIEQYAEKELVDIFRLWILRVLFKLGGVKNIFSHHHGLNSDSIATFLDLSEYQDLDSEELNQNEIIKKLKLMYSKLEKRKRFSSNKILKNNIKSISKLMQLNKYEESILEFSILLNQYEVLQDITGNIGSNLNATQTKKALSIILDIPFKEVDKCFTPMSKFSQSSLLIIDIFGNSLEKKLEFITNNFPVNMLNSDENIEYMIKEIVYQCEVGKLDLKDFNHLDNELSIVLPYLQSSSTDQHQGINILFHGVAGTGKTELTKTIAKELGYSLYEISYSNESGESIDGIKRLRAYKSAQVLLSTQKTLLMFDEVEDVFNNRDHLSYNKAWINRALENNAIPTIWITNDVDSIDSAVIRRFDMVIEVPIPSKKKREEIIHKFSKNQLSQDAITKLSTNETIAPALISRAAKVVSTIQNEDKDKAFELIIDNTLKAQGYKGLQNISNISLPKTYDPTFVNCNRDLYKLTDGIAKANNARVCLYGPAGTGKSAYGKYIADKLDKPLIIKKVSDLQSMWVGECEKNIAKAFSEAKEQNAVLVFDEVDSFLSERENAKANWEVSQVNEMLVQMENFDGIFIATTNLMDNLDRASLRRFDLKLEFSFLNPEQSWRLFKSECQTIGINSRPDSLKNSVKSIALLTPGDFATVIRQNRFNPIENAKDFIKRLQDEVAIKNIDNTRKMGFI